MTLIRVDLSGPEPSHGSVILTQSTTGTAFQRFFSDGMWHSAAGPVLPWDDIVRMASQRKQPLYLLHDASAYEGDDTKAHANSMLARDIQVGDVHRTKKGIVYTVRQVALIGKKVYASVQFVDGGEDVRVFDAMTEVPLTRPHGGTR